MSKKTNNQTAKVNWPITILLIIGCLTVFFPPVSYTHLTLPTNSRV